jgi:LuxR family maltose regulon positive regulatory protein
VPAIEHAQAARDWALGARLLADYWPGLHLAGLHAATHQLLAAFPAETRVADAELAALSAVDELTQGSLETAEWYMGLAERASASVATDGQGQAQLLLGITRLLHARQRGDLQAVAEEAQRLQDIADAPDATRPGLGEDLRALALIHLGSAELWAAPGEEAEHHLERGVALARRTERPYLEFAGLAYQAVMEFVRSFSRAAEQGRRAVELAQRHGWADEPAVGLASNVVGSVLVLQGWLAEAEPWIQRAERALRADCDPSMELAIRFARGFLEAERGRDADALAAFQAGERLAGRLAQPSYMVLPNRSFLVRTLVRLGETERAEQLLARLDDRDRDHAEMRLGLATLRLAQEQPQDAIDALAPVLDGSAPIGLPARLVEPFLLEAIAHDALRDEHAAASALERALDMAEPEGALGIFLLYPLPRLLERQARQRTAHAALIADILSMLAGRKLAPPPAGPQPPLEPLSDSELRVLRYLPTNLSMREIGSDLYVSHNTVRTHVGHLYGKLGTHTRAEAVARARALGLLAPSPLGSFRAPPQVR